jgi:hypothetical protein
MLLPSRGGMHRRRLVLIAATFGLCALGGTAHPNREACEAIRSGLDGAAGLGWVNDSAKAAQLQESFELVHVYGTLLASALSAGASVESTEQIQRDFLTAGEAFRMRAAALKVEIPAEALKTYLEYTRVCSEPY